MLYPNFIISRNPYVNNGREKVMEEKEIESAIVLAGGQGLRLRPLTDNCPKPMVNLLGKPILEWLIRWLKLYGIKKVIVGVAYKKESVINYFKDGSKFGLDIVYSHHSVKAETGEAFNLAIQRYIKKNEIFLAMNGDEIADLNLHDLIRFHFENDVLATLVVAPLRCPYGVVKLNSKNCVTSFIEKPLIDSVLVNAGIYVLDKKVTPYIPKKGSIEKETFPQLVKINQLKAYKLSKGWVTIDTLKDLKMAEKMLIHMERFRNG